MPSRKSPLSTLFGSAAKAFSRNAWPDKALVFHGSRSRLPEPFTTGSFSSIQSLTESCGCPVTASGRRGARQSSFRVETEDPMDLYHSGLTLKLDLAQSELEAAEFFDELAAEVGIPRNQLLPFAFASPRGLDSGINPHIDPVDTLILQLVGTKRLLLSDEMSVPHPLTAASEGRTITESQVAEYGAKGVPQLPRKTRYVTLRPGSAVLIPTGIWHGTQALSESFSISIVLDWPRPADLLLASLKAQLSQHPHWRAPLRRVWRPEGDNRSAMDTLAEFIRAVPGDVERLSPKDMLMQVSDLDARFLMVDPDTRFFRVPTAAVSFDQAKGAKEVQMTIRSQVGQTQSSIDFEARYAQAFRWVAARKGPFTVRQMLQGVKRLSLEDARMVLKSATQVQLAHPILFEAADRSSSRQHRKRL